VKENLEIAMDFGYNKLIHYTILFKRFYRVFNIFGSAGL
jgi:hypothetical protein